jgi:hypothetical protein
MDLSEVVESLAAWAEEHRLVEQAHAELDRWLQSRGGSVGTFSGQEIQAALHEQSLVFRTGRHPVEPVIVTCLALSVYDGECPLGTFRLLTDLQGHRHGIEVELGAEVALDGLGGHVWRFYE